MDSWVLSGVLGDGLEVDEMRVCAGGERCRWEGVGGWREGDSGSWGGCFGCSREDLGINVRGYAEVFVQRLSELSSNVKVGDTERRKERRAGNWDYILGNFQEPIHSSKELVPHHVIDSVFTRPVLESKVGCWGQWRIEMTCDLGISQLRNLEIFCEGCFRCFTTGSRQAKLWRGEGNWWEKCVREGLKELGERRRQLRPREVRERREGRREGGVGLWCVLVRMGWWVFAGAQERGWERREVFRERKRGESVGQGEVGKWGTILYAPRVRDFEGSPRYFRCWKSPFIPRSSRAGIAKV